MRVYHASLTGETKSHCQSEFMKDGSIRCLVAMVAFGMVRVILFQGMDVSDIDLVIVYGVPDSMNQLYQVRKFSTKGCDKHCALYVFLLSPKRIAGGYIC